MNDEIMKNAVDFFNGDQLAAQVWYSKYRLEGETSPRDMATRCTEAIWPHLESRIKDINQKSESIKDYPSLVEYLKDFKKSTLQYLFESFTIIPGGSVLAGIGTTKPVSLSNCYVLSSPEDNYPSIMSKTVLMSELYKRRGGVGIDLSNIRPKDSKVNNAAETSTGIVTVLDQYSNTTINVAQNGRRGAQMISLSVRHPDIMDFIVIKRDLTKITGANISLMMDDSSFMKKVYDYKKKGKDSDYITRFPIDLNIQYQSKQAIQDAPYGVLVPFKDGYIKKYKVSEIWDEFVKSNWQCADPGIIFKDIQDEYSPSHCYQEFRNVTTNPCSEIMMGGEDSCRLLAINMAKMVENPFRKGARISTEGIFIYSFIASLIGDCIVDIELEHLNRITDKIENDNIEQDLKSMVLNLWTKIKETGKRGRRIGLGLTGLGDVYAYVGAKYGDEAVNELVLNSKSAAEWLASVALAECYGSFPGWNPEIDKENAFFKRLAKVNSQFGSVFEKILKYGRRNISISTCAPNGSTSIITQTTSGIEPVFMAEYKRRRKVSETEDYDIKDKDGCCFKEYIVRHKGLQDWMDIPEEDRNSLTNPYSGNEAQDLDYVRRVKNQGQIQQYISHSISSTVNLPNDVSPEIMSDIYILAWENGLKGITCYRDGSKMGVMVSADNSPKPSSDKKWVRPENLDCKIIRMSMNSEPWMAYISILDGKPVEVFTGKASNGVKLDKSITEGYITQVLLENGRHRYDLTFTDPDGFEFTVKAINRCFNPEFYNYSKMISSMLQNGFQVDHVCHVIERLDLGDEINGWKSAVVRALRKYIKSGTHTGEKCPNCGEILIYYEGCVKCPNPECSYTRCGL